MDALRDGVEFTEEEIAYRDSQGQIPLPAEPDPAPADREPDAAAEGAPEVAAQPEEPDPDLIEEGDDSHKGRKVKYGAYLRQKAEADAARKERDEHRQQLEAARREMAVQNARIQERFQQWQAHQAQQQAAAQQPQQPAPPPDPKEDPLGALEWQNNRLRQLEEYAQRSAQDRHQSAQIAQLDNVYRSDNHQAAREVPEYPDAYNFMVSRAQQIVKAQNPGFTDVQVNAEVERQERMLAATALRQGQRPAALILQMASIYGWAPKVQAQAQPAQGQPDAAAQQAKLDAVAQGQAQNRSLSAAGRPGGNTATMTLERFISLSDDEAREWSAKNPREFERIGGGR